MIENFEIEHLDNISEKYDESAINTIKERIALYGGGDAFTLKCNDGVIACGGFAELWKGVAECWLILGDNFHSNWIGAARACAYHIAQRDEYRLQMVVDSNDEVAQRFAAWLGFEKEGLLKMYGINKQDYFMYGRV